jgi:hypothetical protein
MTSISPELALVDPELAARARALLPEPGCFVPASRGSVVFAAAAQALVAPVPGIPKQRRLPPSLQMTCAAVALAVGAVGAFGLAQLHESRPLVRTAPQLGRGAAHARAAEQARSARTYVWPSVPGAARYHVTLRRGRLSIYEGSTRAPRLELPHGLQLSPGRYTWTVALVADAGRSRPLVEETFRVAPRQPAHGRARDAD